MPHIERLLKLAEHLEKEELGHSRFNFAVLSRETACGTAGCALGECPYIWPEAWQWCPSWQRGLRVTERSPSLGGLGVEKSSREWFGLTSEQDSHLFYPLWQDTAQFGGEMLGSDATKEQVAANIRAFCERCQALPDTKEGVQS